MSDGGRVLLIDDLGSGTLLDTAPFGLAAEPMVQASVSAGADVVTFSGDKLLGGPQAGIILGRGELIAQLRRHPLARALRVDKMTLAALDATLQSYERGRALEEIPVWRMISAPADETTDTGRGMDATTYGRVGRQRRGRQSGPAESAVGGGSLPGETLPTHVMAVRGSGRRRRGCSVAHGRDAGGVPHPAGSLAVRPAHGLAGAGRGAASDSWRKRWRRPLRRRE